MVEHKSEQQSCDGFWSKAVNYLSELDFWIPYRLRHFQLEGLEANEANTQSNKCEKVRKSNRTEGTAPTHFCVCGRSLSQQTFHLHMIECTTFQAILSGMFIDFPRSWRFLCSFGRYLHLLVFLMIGKSNWLITRTTDICLHNTTR